jgi:hypothetical protein
MPDRPDKEALDFRDVVEVVVQVLPESMKLAREGHLDSAGGGA